jgi:predicted ATPase
MKGAYKVNIKNNRNSYTFELRRNITILKGESGRGKTTLFEMISDYNRFGKNSGVSVSCDKGIIALAGNDWEEVIDKNPGTIIVIDEDSQFVRSEEFAKVVRGSDNYFLLITRNYLAQLPISVDEIYELSGAKNKKLKKVYREIDGL